MDPESTAPGSDAGAAQGLLVHANYPNTAHTFSCRWAVMACWRLVVGSREEGLEPVGVLCMHAFAAFNMYTCSIAPDWCMHPGPEVVVTAGARAGKEP